MVKLAFKDNSVFSPGKHFVQRSRINRAILVGTILGNYIEFEPVVKRMSFKDISILALDAILLGRSIFEILVEGIMRR